MRVFAQMFLLVSQVLTALWIAWLVMLVVWPVIMFYVDGWNTMEP